MSELQENRPLSPHVGIYRWQISNTLSILHRMTGFGLVIGLIPLALWIWGAAYQAPLFDWLSINAHTIVGKVLLTGWLLAFYYHLANGLRHLNWDIGRGFSLPAMATTGRLVVVAAIVLTIFTWAMACRGTGA